MCRSTYSTFSMSQLAMCDLLAFFGVFFPGFGPYLADDHIPIFGGSQAMAAMCASTRPCARAHLPISCVFMCINTSNMGNVLLNHFLMAALSVYSYTQRTRTANCTTPSVGCFFSICFLPCYSTPWNWAKAYHHFPPQTTTRSPDKLSDSGCW